MGWGMMGIPSTDTIYYDLSKYSNDTKWIIIRRVGERGNKGYNLGWPVKTDEGYTTKSKWFPTQTKAKEYASKIIISIESPQLWERVQKEGIDDFLLRAETFEARGGKRMYCPKCQKNRTWNRGFKKHQMEKGDNPSDFIFYVCQKCNYAYDPKTRLEIKDWRTKFGYDAESKKTNEMDKFFEWILKENPTSKQISKPYSRKVDYLAQRYSDEELKAGLVNAYNAGEINHAKLFAAALGRQGFISIYQAERKVY